MKLIIDTNIVFSAILNTNSKIGDLILNSEDILEFYSASYLKEEIENHKEKLSEISNLTKQEIELIKVQIYSKIQFISEDIIPFEYWKKAVEFVRDVDMDDIAFVTLSLFMENTPIWTGDEKLRTGIQKKGFKDILSTPDIIRLRNELEKK